MTNKKWIDIRKEKLDSHFKKFQELKKKIPGKNNEAWEQLLTTLMYVNDTLRELTDRLKKIKRANSSSSPLQPTASKQKLKKIIAIPKNPNIH